jgi:hypothetical protein
MRRYLQIVYHKHVTYSCQNIKVYNKYRENRHGNDPLAQLTTARRGAWTSPNEHGIGFLVCGLEKLTIWLHCYYLRSSGLRGRQL